MTRHLEESERAMQERVQRLEASRLTLEEVSTCWLGARLSVSEPHQDPPTDIPLRPGDLMRWDMGSLPSERSSQEAGAGVTPAQQLGGARGVPGQGWEDRPRGHRLCYRS